MTLTRARVIFATGGFGQERGGCDSLGAGRPGESSARGRRGGAMRSKLEASRPRHDLKRGPGGLADLEFIVQYLLLVHAPRSRSCCGPISGTRWRRCAGMGS